MKVKVGQLQPAVPEVMSAPPKPKRQKYGKISFEPLTDEARGEFADAEGAVVAGKSGAAAARRFSREISWLRRRIGRSNPSRNWKRALTSCVALGGRRRF